MLFKEAVDEFLLYLEIEKNLADNTLVGYESDLKRFEQFLIQHDRSLELSTINKALIRRYIQYLVKHDALSARSLHRKISALRSFAKYCLSEDLIQTNFMHGIEKPKLDKSLPVYMTLDELKCFLNYLNRADNRFALRNKAMFMLLVLTGMRRSELVNLTWRQLDLVNKTIRILGKGKKERIVPLHPSVVPVLIDYREAQGETLTNDNSWIFLNKNGTKLNPRGLHKIFKEALENAGLDSKRYSLHHLRHTFATLLLQTNSQNVDLRILQELLGHESLATTQIYTHVEYEQKQNAINTFDLM